MNEARRSIRDALLEFIHAAMTTKKPNYCAKEQAIHTAISRLKQIAAVPSEK